MKGRLVFASLRVPCHNQSVTTPTNSKPDLQDVRYKAYSGVVSRLTSRHISDETRRDKEIGSYITVASQGEIRKIGSYIMVAR